VAIIHDPLHVLPSIERWSNQDPQFVDELGGQESAVRFGSAFHHKVRDVKLSGEHIQQARNVELHACRDNVRDAVSRKFGQMAIGDISTNENDNVVAAQLRALKVKLAGTVERNGERGSIRLGNVDRSVNLSRPGWRARGPALLISAIVTRPISQALAWREA
jgi:hypothetical protein